MAEIQIAPLGERTYMRLKSWLPAQPSRLGSTELPTNIGTVVPGLTRILCLGPGEWLVTSAAQSMQNFMDHIDGDLPDGLALVDLSDGLLGLEVRGAAARELLSKGCGLDLHPSVFRPGQCARTRFAQIAVVIECHTESHFEMHVARSYFDYLHAWVLDAALEFEPAAAT